MRADQNSLDNNQADHLVIGTIYVTYICDNLKLQKIVESANVKVDDIKTKGFKTQDNSHSNERIKNGDEEENEEF